MNPVKFCEHGVFVELGSRHCKLEAKYRVHIPGLYSSPFLVCKDHRTELTNKAARLGFNFAEEKL